jgi:hypothetical protein
MAYSYQKRAARVGFDWESIDGVWDKLYEEIEEFKRRILLRSGGRGLGYSFYLGESGTMVKNRSGNCPAEFQFKIS